MTARPILPRYLLVASTMVLPAAAVAQQESYSATDPVQHRPLARTRSFALLDRNHDGFITRREAQVQPDLESRFADFDHNGDGSISRSEFSAFEHTREPENFTVFRRGLTSGFGSPALEIQPGMPVETSVFGAPPTTSPTTPGASGTPAPAPGTNSTSGFPAGTPGLPTPAPSESTIAPAPGLPGTNTAPPGIPAQPPGEAVTSPAPGLPAGGTPGLPTPAPGQAVTTSPPGITGGTAAPGFSAGTPGVEAPAPGEALTNPTPGLPGGATGIAPGTPAPLLMQPTP